MKSRNAGILPYFKLRDNINGQIFRYGKHCTLIVLSKKTANKIKGALTMKSKKTVFTSLLTLVLALSIVTVSAAAVSANAKKSGECANDPCIAAAEPSGECVGQPLEGFVKNLSSLSEQEKTALLADLAEIESLEMQIDELYYRMTDENADQLYGEIDALYEKLDSVLDRNAELWDRVDAEYDEKIAANEPDMTFELKEVDLEVCERSR